MSSDGRAAWIFSRFFSAADEKTGFRVPHKIGEFGGRIAGVQRQIDGARPETGQVEDQHSRAFFRLHRNPVARLDPMPGQHMGETARAREHVAEAEGLIVRQEKEWLFRIGRSGHKAGVQIVGQGVPPVCGQDVPAPAALCPVWASSAPRGLCFPGAGLTPFPRPGRAKSAPRTPARSPAHRPGSRFRPAPQSRR